MKKCGSSVSKCHAGVLVLTVMLALAGCTISTPEREYVIIPKIKLDPDSLGIGRTADASHKEASDVAGNAPRQSVAGMLLGAFSPKKPITPEIVDNLETKQFSFRNGKDSYEDPTDPVRISAGIAEKAFGDLNGDGVTDAAVVFWYNTGGSGIFEEICAVVATPENPLVTESIPLGDRVGIESVRIVRGIIVLDLLTHAPHAGLANADVRAVCKFKFAGNRLVNLTPKVLANEDREGLLSAP